MKKNITINLTRILPIAFLVCNALESYSQKTKSDHKLKIIDISQVEIRMLNSTTSLDSLTRNKIFRDSVYQPYKIFWEGYVGGEKSVSQWLTNVQQRHLAAINKRNAEINGAVLLKDFNTVKDNMKKLTGYDAEGNWYIAYGPGWTDLGGLRNIGMVIDLSHGNNSSNERILKMFPHELTHQIYGGVNHHQDTAAIASIIGEGFAVYMNQVYWGDKYSAADNLGYTTEEFKACISYESDVREFFATNWNSTDKSTIDKFRNRSVHIRAELPGAIGYYIGFQIVKQYVARHGKNSWKDVFVKSPGTILKESGYL